MFYYRLEARLNYITYVSECFYCRGEATVDAAELQSFMRTAQQLEISSLCDTPSSQLNKYQPQQVNSPTTEQQVIKLEGSMLNMKSVFDNKKILSNQSIKDKDNINVQKCLKRSEKPDEVKYMNNAHSNVVDTTPGLKELPNSCTENVSGSSRRQFRINVRSHESLADDSDDGGGGGNDCAGGNDDGSGNGSDEQSLKIHFEDDKLNISLEPPNCSSSSNDLSQREPQPRQEPSAKLTEQPQTNSNDLPKGISTDRDKEQGINSQEINNSVTCKEKCDDVVPDSDLITSVVDDIAAFEEDFHIKIEEGKTVSLAKKRKLSPLP